MLKKTFIWLFLTISFVNAQQFEFRLTIQSNDKLQKETLSKLCNADENFEGYFSDTDLFDFIPNGKIIKGGFNFLDKDNFGGIADAMKSEWLKNNSADSGLNDLLQFPEFTKALSFQLSALTDLNKKDSVHLFLKYSLFSNENKKSKHSPEFNLNVKLYYKHLIVPLSKEIPINIFSSVFKGYNFSLTVEPINNTSKVLECKLDEVILRKIAQSVSESKMTDSHFNFEVTFSKRNALPKKSPGQSDIYGYVNCKGVSEYNSIVNVTPSGIRDEFSALIYYCSFNIPFSLANKEKMADYSGYKTISKYFNSNYRILIIPVIENKDHIVVDIYVEHKKLALEENFNRWTPIYKRIEIPLKGGVRLDIPKENWTANFIRQGERYNIYGMPDYEKFIDETIYIQIITEVIK